MKAKVVTGAGYQRNELGSTLPLSTPFSLHIFPAHRCNLKCNYCLHSLPASQIANKGFKKELMNFSILEKSIEDAALFPERFKVIIFAGWGEPLLHPQLVDMVKLVKQANVAERIEIVSNGTLLTPNLSEQLIAAGLDRLRISIQGIHSKTYYKLAGVAVDFNNLVKNITYFHKNKKQTTLYIKTVSSSLPSEAERKKFLDIFSPISDEIAIEHIIPVITDIDHSKFGSTFANRHCGGKADKVSVCPFPFYMSAIHPDGSYAPCCCPELPIDLGNTKETSIYDIWNNSQTNTFRTKHLLGERGGSPICRSCLRPQYDIQDGDNIDTYLNQLLPSYTTNQF